MAAPFSPEPEKQAEQREFVASLNQPPKSPAKQNVAPPRRRRGRKVKAHDPPPRAAYTIDEFASAIRLSKPTLYRMMHLGQLRYVRFGSLRRIPVTELTRLLGQNSTSS